MKHITVLLFIATLVLCRAFPAAESGGESAVVMSSNPFDLGPVTACRRPSTNVCSIDYEVPASIAALADIIEFEIRGRLELARVSRGTDDSCVSGLKETLCAFRFPRCEGTANVVMKSAPNCTQKIASCPTHIKKLMEAEDVCQLNATVPLDSCAPLSESQVEFRRQGCSVIEASTSVTAWILEYMKFTDREWDTKLTTIGISTLGERPGCTNNLLQYYCGFYGQCVGNDRIEIRNSEGFCNDMISCYPDETAGSLRNNINCELWPLDSERPSSNSPHSTTQPSTSLSQTNSRPISQQPSWPSPPTIGNGASLLQVTGTLLLISLMLSIFISR